MLTKIYDLAYEVDGDSVHLEQDMGCGEVHQTFLHAIHVRMLASELGLLQGDEDAWKRVETLERRLRVLRDRIAALDQMLWAIPVYPPGSGSDSSENVYSDATLDIADEFCADLGNTPRNGSVSGGNTPKSGGVSTGNAPETGATQRRGDTKISSGEQLKLEGAT